MTELASDTRIGGQALVMKVCVVHIIVLYVLGTCWGLIGDLLGSYWGMLEVSLGLFDGFLMLI